jgi:hypothetical protein
MAKNRPSPYREESVDSMGKDPLKRDRRYDDAGNPAPDRGRGQASRDALIERVWNQNDGGPEKLPEV